MQCSKSSPTQALVLAWCVHQPVTWALGDDFAVGFTANKHISVLFICASAPRITRREITTQYIEN